MTIPNKMYALLQKHSGYANTQTGPVIEDLSDWLEGKEIDVPAPEDGQVLIRLIRANINPSDLHYIKGEYGMPRFEGKPAGFEAVGEVVSAGKGGEGLVGKRVGFIASASGAWAEYAMADAASCIPVIDQVRDEDAATLFVNPLTAIAMFEEVKKSNTTSFIMTAAASQLCKLLTGLAKEDGMDAISIVRRDDHIEPLKALGASQVLNCTSDAFSEQIAAVMKEMKPRIMLDAVADQVSSDMFFAMPSRARWMIYGKLSMELPALTQVGQFIFMDKHIEGFWLTKWMQQASREEQVAAATKVQTMFASGKWKTDVRATISLRDAFDQLPAALSQINTGKVMLVP